MAFAGYVREIQFIQSCVSAPVVNGSRGDLAVLKSAKGYTVNTKTSNSNEFEVPAPMVFVVDDDPSVQEAIASLLRTIGVRTQLFSQAAQLLAHLATLTPGAPHFPNCLILDVRMPTMGGLEAQARLVNADVHIPIIFISAYGDVTMAAHAMKAGAHDFLPKPFRGQTLVDAVQSAIAYDRMRHELSEFQRELNERYASLTERERAILRLIARGMMNKQIAWELGLSEITVKVHRAQLMRKMKAKSVAELVRMEDRLGAHESHS